MVSFYALSVQFSVLVMCLIVKSGNRLHKGLKNLVERVISSPLDSSWHITCLEPLLGCQIEVLGLWLVTLE